MSTASDLIATLVTPLNISPEMKAQLSEWYTALATIIDDHDSGGSFSGTMDDIENGATYVKTENNYTDGDAAIVAGVTSALSGKAPSLGPDDNYVTDAEKTKLSNLSGINTGDQDLSGKSNVGHGHIISDVSGLQTALDGKAPTLGADDNYVTDAEKTKLSNLSGTNSGDNAVNTLYSGLAASKLDVPTGTPDGTKYLRDDNTWQPIIGGSGLAQYQVRRILRR